MTHIELELELTPEVLTLDDRPPVSEADPKTKRGRRHWPLTAIIPGVFLALVTLTAIAAPLLAPDSPTVGSVADRLKPIGSAGHLLGTDGQGRDILSRLMYGARPSLLAGFVPVVVAGLIGTSLGIIAGLGSKRLQSFVMRALDVLYAFPAVLLAIAITTSLGPGIKNAILALAVVLIPPVARVVETEVARLRTADFMDSARCSGAGKLRIAVGHVLPNVAPTVLVYCTAMMGLSIVYAGGLSFLGLGMTPPNPEWGLMLNELRENLYTQPALALIPAVVIMVVSVACNVLGDGLRTVLDVRSELS
jgi:peptide/nickel transport system permease protein